jgi:rubredoxin
MSYKRRTLSTSPLSSDSSLRPLNYDDTYTCPVCGHGELSVLTLTEAFACSFCRHIFTANLEAQSLQMVDSVQPMVWFWTGERWRHNRRPDGHVTAVVWSFALAIACLPALLVVVSNYMFPPIDSGGLNQFSFIWTLITLMAHGGIVAWLIAEHYQWPWYVTTKIKLSR